MKNTFGTSVTVTLFGESHGKEIGAVLDGMAPGIPVREEDVARLLTRRRPTRAGESQRREPDLFRIVSGVIDGHTTGTPICVLIPNTDCRSSDYQNSLPRPGHADYVATLKYHGMEDARGGGHFSGRLTAPLTAVGAIALSALAKKGIRVATHLASFGGIADRPFGGDGDFALLDSADYPTLDPNAGKQMQDAAASAEKDGDSLGGILETIVAGVPGGVGEPWFDTVEGTLSHALFSIPAVKGVEFGEGFGFAAMRGSTANDAMRMNDGKVTFVTNHNGGVNGGVTNGDAIRFRVAVKPAPSIAKPQKTVNLSTGKDEILSLQGRHDAAIAPRAVPVVDAVTALVLCDLLALRYGTDYFIN